MVREEITASKDEDYIKLDPLNNISQTSLGKAENLKKDFYAYYGLNLSTAVCMVTGISPPQVENKTSTLILAHIIPRSTERIIRELISFTLGDIDSIRNCLLLCLNIERAFDELDISFVPSDNPFQFHRFKMFIWNNGIRDKPIFPDASRLIGQFDNYPLNLVVSTKSGAEPHDPFKQALSYQAYMAFRKWNKIDPSILLPVDCDLSQYRVNVDSYRNSRRDFEGRFRRDFIEEVGDEENGAL